MEEELWYKLGGIYFGSLGLLVAGVGLAKIVLGALNKTVLIAPIIFTGSFMLWRGVILLFAGLFYLMSVQDFSNIHQQAKAVVGSLMIWIVAGTNLFAMILGSIPGGEDRWFNTTQAFLSAYSPPYNPSLFLLPFSLFMIYYVKKEKTG